MPRVRKKKSPAIPRKRRKKNRKIFSTERIFLRNRKDSLKIIAGLGNPGLKYRNTRHNAGFHVCREIARRHRKWLWKRKYFCCYNQIRLEDETAVLALPQTYMNRSGIALKSLMDSFQPEPADVLVVVDDFHLPLGTLRFRKNGSSGGHNGLVSVCEEIGEEFCRLRIGIGPVPDAADIIPFVLGSWSRDEMEPVREIFQRSVSAVETYIRDGISSAMNRYNAGK